MSTARIPVFSDVNLFFGQNDKAEVVYDIDAFNEKINNLLFVGRGERLFRRGFGGWLVEQLFEPVDETTATKILQVTSQVFHVWLPTVRLLMNESEITPLPDANGYDIRLVYQLPSGLTGEFRREVLNGVGGQ